jgi:autotransporter-associated beta strand protein
VPNSKGAEANFWRSITGKRSITLDGDKTIGAIAFDARHRYLIDAGNGGKLIFDNSNSAATLSSTLGYHIVNVDVMLASRLTADIKTNTFTINGVISGNAGLTKKGNGTLVLGGVNTYTGDTIVEAGTLSLRMPSIADTAIVRISTGATLDLNFNGADVIDGLTIDGKRQPRGIWGSVGSQARSTSPLFKGIGTLEVRTTGD